MVVYRSRFAGVAELADARDLKSGGSICPPNLKSPVKSSVFQFSFPESIAQFSPEFSPVWSLQFSYAAVMESVDIVDLKFTGRNTVRVRVPSAAPPSGQALLALILFYNAACQRWIDDCPGKPSIGVLSGTVNMLSIASPTKVLDAVSKCA